MADRRRINGPIGATAPPVYDSPPPRLAKEVSGDAIRKICKYNIQLQLPIREEVPGVNEYAPHFSSENGRDPFRLWIRLS